MKNFFLLFLALTTIPAFATNDDPFNGFIWNRENLGTSEVDRDDWYEWWYFKLIDPATNAPFYFLYGVTNPWDVGPQPEKSTSRSFVGFGNFADRWTVEQEFPVETIRAEYGRFALDFGNGNSASHSGLTGQIQAVDKEQGKPRQVRWNLSTTPDWSYNAMGWTMKLPWASNIFWYPAQASLFASGTVEVDGKVYEVRSAHGYQDRNWGRSFPKWWAWIVASEFEGSPGTVLAGGGGVPKVINIFEMPVFSMGLRHEGKEYSFRFNDGDWIEMDIAFGQWRLKLINRDGFRLEVTGHAPEERFMDLVFRTPQGEDFHDLEALMGTLEITLSEWKPFQGGWQEITRLRTEKGGLEYGSRDARLGTQPTATLLSTPAEMLQRFSPL